MSWFGVSFFLVGLGGAIMYGLTRSEGLRRPCGLLEWGGWTGSLFLVMGGIALASLTAAQQTGRSRRAGSPSVIGQVAPELRFRTVESNEEQSISEFRGRVVLLNLWATWCPPCLDELPQLNKLQEEYGDRGVVVVTISDERPQTIRRFERNRFELRTVNGYLPEASEWPAPYDRVLKSRPYSFVIGPKGQIRNMWAGARDFTFFERAIRPYLSDRPGGR